MAETLKPDICVIGGGSGGLSVAAAAAAFGVPVVLVERHKMGGDCLNTGCVPSKALLAAAKRAQIMRSAAPFGVTAQAVDIDFGKVHDHGVKQALFYVLLGTRMPSIRDSPPRCAPLPPTTATCVWSISWKPST